jgi:N-acetylglucosaminyldiphosphoundecaprenol N-acetyl-beta-D-mannosaminyltransferase
MDLFGFTLTNTTLQSATDSIAGSITANEQRTILFLNAAKVTERKVDYSSLLGEADLLLADGQSIVFASRLFRQPLVERVAGVDLMDKLLERASDLGWKVFFLGSTNEVLADVVEVVGNRYPGAVIAGTRDGYFDRSLDSQVAAEISQTSPDLLFVAMPSPRKEQWVLEFGPQSGAKASMGIGGSLEVLTGRVDRAPKIVQSIGLEWAWRVAQEPSRLWRRYAQSNLRFLALTAREMLRSTGSKQGSLANTAQSQGDLVGATLRTRQRMKADDLKGFDPYDALLSPVFRLPLLRSNWVARFGLQQVILRSPVNLRPVLRTPKQLNAVTAGLYVQGLADLADANLIDSGEAAAEAAAWIAELRRLRSSGWSGTCWGYPFPWEGRRGAHRTPTGFPTVVATGMILNGLHRAWKVFGIDEARALVADGAGFVLEDLNVVDGDERAFCWSYSPADHQAVLNATMKGTRLLAQAEDAGAGLGAEVMAKAAASARYVSEHQQADGGWPYAVAGDPRSWRDSFHTAYILECFDTFQALTQDEQFNATITRGWEHYRSTFFTKDLVPRYFDTADEPLEKKARYGWEQDHQPNLTGTPYAHKPKGLKGHVVRKDYEPWVPK